MHLIRLLDSLMWQTAFIREAVTLPALYWNHTFDSDCDVLAASIDSAVGAVKLFGVIRHWVIYPILVGEFNGLGKPAEVDFGINLSE